MIIYTHHTENEKTFGAVPPSPKKVILIFSPVVTMAIKNCCTKVEVCNQHSGKAGNNFFPLKKQSPKSYSRLNRQ